MPDLNATSLIATLKRSVQADPKKAGILTVLGLVLLLMVGRLALRGQDAPQSASAGPLDLSEPSNKPESAGRTISRHGGAPASMQEWLSSRKKSSADRNLFAVRLEYFPRDGGKIVTNSTEGEDGFWDGVAKSMAAQADQRKERQILAENLQLKAAELKLQSTVMGAVPKALVNGELVKEGDVVASGTGANRVPFRVLKVEARRIIVEREGIKLAIPMK